MENNTNTESTADSSQPLNVGPILPTEPVIDPALNVIPPSVAVQSTPKNNQRVALILAVMIVVPAIIFGLFVSYSNTYSVAIQTAADAKKTLNKPVFQESTNQPVSDIPTNKDKDTATNPATTDTNFSSETVITKKPTTQNLPSVSNMTNITVGINFYCGIGPDSLAYCWGVGSDGELGNYDLNVHSSSVPVAVYAGDVLKGKTIKYISAGDHHTCVIASDNQAYCWGIGTYGELGNSYQQVNNYPTAVDTGGALKGKTIKSITSAARYSCVVASDNLTYCWGLGIFGTDEHGNIKSQLSPALHAAL